MPIPWKPGSGLKPCNRLSSIRGQLELASYSIGSLRLLWQGLCIGVRRGLAPMPTPSPRMNSRFIRATCRWKSDSHQPCDGMRLRWWPKRMRLTLNSEAISQAMPRRLIFLRSGLTTFSVAPKATHPRICFMSNPIPRRAFTPVLFMKGV